MSLILRSVILYIKCISSLGSFKLKLPNFPQRTLLCVFMLGVSAGLAGDDLAGDDTNSSIGWITRCIQDFPLRLYAPLLKKAGGVKCPPLHSLCH
ncbi:hypothetical protein CC79DRAFT_1333881 [Sarocladium strictum]